MSLHHCAGALLGLLACACQATPSAGPPAHRGPVTSIIAEGEVILACSQGFVQSGDDWIRPGFRPFAIAANESYLMVAGGDPAEHTAILLLDRSGTRLATRRFGDDVAYAVDLHPTDALAVIGCADGSVQLLALPGLQVVQRLAEHNAPCRTVRFSTDGGRLASGGRDGLVHVHDLKTSTHRTHADHTAGVECLWFRGDRLYSGAQDGKVRVHQDGRLLRTYLNLRQPVMSLTELDGQVYLGLRDGEVRILAENDASTTPAGRFAGPLFALAAVDGKLIAGGMGTLGWVNR